MPDPKEDEKPVYERPSPAGRPPEEPADPNKSLVDKEPGEGGNDADPAA